MFGRHGVREQIEREYSHLIVKLIKIWFTRVVAMSEMAQPLMEKAMNDRGFADKLKRDPEAILAEHDVSPEEEKALMDGDEKGIRDILGDVMADKVAVVVIVI